MRYFRKEGAIVMNSCWASNIMIKRGKKFELEYHHS